MIASTWPKRSTSTGTTQSPHYHFLFSFTRPYYLGIPPPSSSMSWTQVYISGLSQSIDPSDDDIETLLDSRYDLTNSDALLWAGPGTTLIKRDDGGSCRGFAFLTFYSTEGASTVVDRINNNNTQQRGGSDSTLPWQRLRAELSDPKAAKEQKKGKERRKVGSNDISDLRLRRQRKAPIRKHPVIRSSDGSKTNLGNKTR